MDMRFARCSYFCFLIETGPEFILNPFQDMEQHIAPDVVNWLKEQGVDQIITGEIGSFAQKSLKESHIQAVLIDNNNYTVQAIIQKIGWKAWIYILRGLPDIKWIKHHIDQHLALTTFVLKLYELFDHKLGGGVFRIDITEVF